MNNFSATDEQRLAKIAANADSVLKSASLWKIVTVLLAVIVLTLGGAMVHLKGEITDLGNTVKQLEQRIAAE